MSGKKRGERGTTIGELAQKKSCRIQFRVVRRVLQQVESLFVSGFFLLRHVLETQILVGGFVRKEHAVIEGVFTAQVVSKHDVRQLVREHHREACLIRQYV